jgi:proteasome-associated ATPase
MDPQDSGRLRALLERLRDQAPRDDARTQNLIAALEAEVEASERERAETQETLAQYEAAYEKLTAPANRIGVYLSPFEDGRALVALGDTDYVAEVDPAVPHADLTAGARVRLNEAYAVVGVVPDSSAGTVTKVAEALDDGRLRVGSDPQNQQGRLVARGANLSEAAIKTGDEVRIEPTGRVAVEHFGRPEAQEYFVEEVPEVPWSAVGGQEEAIRLIRETIEHPLLYPDLYRRYDKKPVKGVLLYGPPGCGKTLIGKAIAYNLAAEYGQRLGREVKECFLHISGPKILNMWLGETERMVREIFATAREKAKEGRLVVIFMDEAESVLRTRSSGRWLNISNTVVPQFCAELDGMVALDNVVLVLTSNRPDYIDPAVLRPERIDRKVKVARPDRASAKQILGIYLHDRLPLDPALVAEHVEPECARLALVESAVAHLWRQAKETEFMRVQLRNGTTETLHWKDFVSGALLKSVVDRAKDAAIRRAIAAEGPTKGSKKAKAVEEGVTEADLKAAIADEFRENEIFPKTDALEDWLKLLDLEPESVASVKPVRPEKGAAWARKTIA